MSTIDPQINNLAIGIQHVNGLDKNVVLAQWQAEEGVDSLSQWPGFNPAGITAGNPAVDKLAIQLNGKPATNNGFLVFSNAVVGAGAYGKLLQTDPAYAGVRQAIATKDPQKELQALVDSGWDAGHYTQNTRGDKLFQSYDSIAHANVKYDMSQPLTASDIWHDPATNQANAQARTSNFMNFLGLGGMSPWNLLVILGGVVLIIVTVYRVATK